MSLSECCRKIIVHDCLALRKKTVTLLQSGYLVTDTDVCAKCHSPIYSSGFIDEPKGGKTAYDDDPSNWTISRIGGQP
ncbi:unnamed protein product, partial [Rotaria socialis]